MMHDRPGWPDPDDGRSAGPAKSGGATQVIRRFFALIARIEAAKRPMETKAARPPHPRVRRIEPDRPRR